MERISVCSRKRGVPFSRCFSVDAVIWPTGAVVGLREGEIVKRRNLVLPAAVITAAVGLVAFGGVSVASFDQDAATTAPTDLEVRLFGVHAPDDVGVLVVGAVASDVPGAASPGRAVHTAAIDQC
jgi:hypothetical protein